MVVQLEALAKLLNDDDPETVRLVKEQLANLAEQNPSALESLISGDDAVVSYHARDVLSHRDDCEAVDDFTLHCHFAREGFDIEQAIWALARVVEPGRGTEEFEQVINAWGREFLSRVACATSNAERVEILSRFLSDELNFRGNSDRYYCQNNSVLSRVIESRMGIPITLTLIYQIIGARGGMKIEGINLPGHFIARHGEVYFDPFHGGRILCRCDVKSILDRQRIEFKESHLKPATSRQFLLRILANLLYVYDLDGENEKRHRIKCWMDALSAGSMVK
jgi:regulator of sirC expression with transglutaminase-like and TPR domain